MEENRKHDFELPKNFNGVWIPKEVWYSEKISWLEKCMVAEIHWLAEQAKGYGERGCWASNTYLGNLFGLNKITVSQHLKRIIDAGFLSVDSFDGRTRILVSNIKTRVVKPNGKKSKN